MTRMKRTSRERLETPREDGNAERYTGAFARVRLVRAWIAVAAAVVAMLYAYLALLERLVRWWLAFPTWRGVRLHARLIAHAAALLSIMMPPAVHAAAVPSTANVTASVDPAWVKQVTVTHTGGGAASTFTNTWNTTTFTVTNTGTEALAVNLVSNFCSGALLSSSCSASPSSASLAVGGSVLVTVSFKGDASPGTGQLVLYVNDAPTGTQLAASSIVVTVKAAGSGPIVSAAPHLGDRRDVGLCIADCFEVTHSYTTPAYVSLDVPRAITILYRSGRAHSYGTFALDVFDPNTQAGSSLRLKLKDASGAYITFVNGSTELFFSTNTSGPTRIAGLFVAATTPTSALLYTAEVTATYSGGSQGTTSLPIRIIVINDKASPLGAGVQIVGLQRLNFNQAGGVLVTEGSGSAAFYTGSCSVSTTCSFTPPAGEFSTLSTVGNGTYRRVYPDGTTLTFNSSGHHVSTADRFGTTTQIGYGQTSTGATAPVSITDPVGQSITLWYRDAGSTNGGQYKVGSLGRLSTPTGLNAPIGIDQLNHLIHWVDVDAANSAVAQYDQYSRLTQINDKAGGTWNYAYAYGTVLSYVDPPAVTIAGGASVRPRTQLREAYSGLFQAASGGGGTASSPIPVASVDVRAAITDPRGNATLFSLNRYGSPTRVYAPLTAPDSSEYDFVTGQPTRTISPTGHDVRYTWSADKLTNVRDLTLGKSDSIVYEAQYSLPKQVISGNGQNQWFYYDQTKTGWPLQSSRIGSSSAPLSTYTVDAYARATQVTDPGGHVTSYAYATTGLRNRTSVTAPNGQTTTTYLDAAGRPDSTRFPNGKVIVASYDVLNRFIWTMTKGYADTTRVLYDNLDNPTIVTDAKGQVYTTQYNAMGWPVKRIDPVGRADSAAYDLAGNVVYVRTRADREVRMEYDVLNRLTKRIGVGGADTISYAYDVGGRWVRAETRRAGALVSLDTIHTDSVGRTIKESTVRAGSGSSWYVGTYYGASDPGRTSVAVYKAGMPSSEGGASYSYDATKRLSMIQLTSGSQTTFGYNADQLVDSIGQTPALGQRLYYTSSHALAQRLYNVAGVKSVFDRSYRTDSLARLVERATGSGTEFQTFDYDLKGRLAYWSKKTQSGPTCVNLGGWGYDCTGTGVTNVLTVAALYDKVENPDDFGTTLTTGNRLTAFNGASMTYDFDGSLATKGARTYHWDDFGQLKEVRQSGTVVASFTYDGFGRRIKKTSSAGTVQYVWDGAQLVLEADGSGNTLQTYSYYPGIDRLHSVTPGGQTYYASIELATGDVNGLIKPSDTSIPAQYRYTPWGELEVDSQTVNSVRVNSLRWKGLVYDHETGLYAMRARYYDPQLRRFISEDPIGLAGGINQYAFVGGDPVNGSDPSGLDPCTTEQLQQGWQDIKVGSGDGPDSKTECMSNGGLPPIVTRATAPDFWQRIWSSMWHGSDIYRGMHIGGDLTTSFAIAEVIPGRPGGSAGITVVSHIKDSRALVRAAEALEGRAQADINRLLARLLQGNLSPGLGNRYLFGGIIEARAQSGARLYFRYRDNVIEILAKSTKHDQGEVISILRGLYR